MFGEGSIQMRGGKQTSGRRLDGPQGEQVGRHH